MKVINKLFLALFALISLNAQATFKDWLDKINTELEKYKTEQMGQRTPQQPTQYGSLSGQYKYYMSQLAKIRQEQEEHKKALESLHTQEKQLQDNLMQQLASKIGIA